MRLTVRVERRHIDKGKPVRCRLCPIALALNEQHPRGERPLWATDTEDVFLLTWDPARQRFDDADPSADARFSVPIEARKWASDFDAGRPVQPFTFELTDEVA